MGRYSSIPTLFDECKTVSISFLKQHGYLNQDQRKTGTITWSRGEGASKRITGSISMEVNTLAETPYIELDYKSNDRPINYRLNLVFIPSNIGKGVVWFFICPNTGKRCRKLYLAEGYFLHREAFKGCCYEKQTYSHKNRQLHRQFECVFGTDKAYEQIYSKHFKKYYSGRPTKRYLKLNRQIQQADKVDAGAFMTLFKS